MIKYLLFVGSGGALGSILRYLIAIYINKKYSGEFPLATFFINITGCILIGLFTGWAERYHFINAEIRVFLITGICGGYTTFSTFSSENYQLLQNNNFITLCLYISFSLFLGIIGVWLGNFLSKI